MASSRRGSIPVRTASHEAESESSATFGAKEGRLPRAASAATRLISTSNTVLQTQGGARAVVALGFSGDAAVEDRRELGRVDVPARDDADDLAAARLAGQGRGDRGCACSLGDDAGAFGQQSDRGGDVVETRDEAAVQELVAQLEHLGEHVRRPDPVDETRLVVDELRLAGRERGSERGRGRDLARVDAAAGPERAPRGGDP